MKENTIQTIQKIMMILSLKKKFTFTVNNIKKWIYKKKDDKLEEITNNQLEIEKK